MRYVIISLIVVLSGCIGVPEGIKPVEDFDKNRYLGTWYEIARLDHSFERGLEKVTAQYAIRNGGGVKVINRGFDTANNVWDQAEGKAFFVNDERTGYLKVSFFGPFYGAYIVFDLGDDYEYAFVTSSNKSYLWFLSRTPQVDDDLMAYFLQTITALGFETDELIFVDQPTHNNKPLKQGHAQ